jgi:two-component system, LytTR family, sensor kinase
VILTSTQLRRAANIAKVFAAWTLAAVVLATQAWVSSDIRGEPIAWGRTLAIWLPWAWIWAGLTPLALMLVERCPLERPHAVRATLLHVIAGLLLAAFNLALFAVIAPVVNAIGVRPTWAATFARLVGTMFLLNAPVYWLIVGTAQALRIARQARERERRALRLEVQLAEARLLVLRAQLEPHFLFNALNTVSVLMRENVDAADRVLILLSGLLRRALDTSATAEVELRQEVAFLEAYLALEQVRFADRLSYRLAIDPQLLDQRVPSLILQPLVENAVRHGLGDRKDSGQIEIAAARRGDMLQLTVRDNGSGMAADAPIGVGLSNTRSRLQLLYGNRHSFELSAADGGGLTVCIGIPLAMAEPA